ncbi:LysR substrate-binding domain-containing protein [Pelagibius sp. 7325]|uniref:LysR substrate-binding domain-containing protein n=1 Tax=Pelagibius sp. 7325 TaxID=3131994 RepID=UPI0030EBBB76
MRRVLPSLPALTVFEASARHGSFTRAAEELNLSQSAVSKRVASLEDFLGTPLFERVRQRIVLTEAGQHYLARIREALEIMEEATMETLAFRSGGSILNIATLPSFGNRWLLPRIGRFTEAYPQVALNVMARQWPFDLTQENIDAAILYAASPWPGGPSERLLSEEVIPVCAPGFLAMPTLEALSAVPLLHHRARPRAWQHWLEAGGASGVNAYRGSRFEQFDMIIRAAIAGAGVGLVPRFMVAEELAAGLLEAPFPRGMKSAESYYLVYPERKRSLPALQLFRAWILEEAQPGGAEAGHS